MIYTRIFGNSDDDIYAEGEYNGQYTNNQEAETGILLVISDGTILKIKYGKENLGIWSIIVLKKGNLFWKIEHCDDEDAKIYSDIAYFNEGITFIFACANWEKIT